MTEDLFESNSYYTLYILQRDLTMLDAYATDKLISLNNIPLNSFFPRNIAYCLLLIIVLQTQLCSSSDSIANNVMLRLQQSAAALLHDFLRIYYSSK
jgi:hypothetical protein